MKGTIYPCTHKDLPELQKISIETFKDTFAAENDPNDLTTYLSNAYGLVKLEKELSTPDSRFFFIYLEDQLAGYLKLNTNKAQTEMSDKNGLEIERIYIRKHFKRQGLGRQLLDFAFAIADQEKREQIWLGVWEHNQNALRFYQTFGFVQVGSHDFYVGDDQQTDLIMAKELL
ncbi:N-acetyltransferase [Enterococcus dongliensis]|uniref:N-acetyltransferase n=1 Tax=Enterococcus dongliensis TaxID=2559925 RepID=A0AAW8TL27_9ENTE|nr:N-acetyltransferase [Enterococcus dongliensis]MDT2596444.1 N-acetyltransferase [Enterococcus dongliensis]MDT2604066.1 N-acetyltransferase [Enterococcus dongliensis]MDT2634486.1 N-acetyltransferase [Enterococcus dongliensis]MDT2636436.1 N-acetyltransferase [Enterococcus dongliensis]MDT2640541.1 N-acetyltransferase [Enterococcus dongliensis]